MINYGKTLLQITAALLKITTVCYYKLRELYYKLRQQVITNYGSFMKLLQIAAAFGVITNYNNTSLQITAGITNYDVITNYVVTTCDLILPLKKTIFLSLPRRLAILVQTDFLWIQSYFTEEILNRKLNFLCSEFSNQYFFRSFS